MKSSKKLIPISATTLPWSIDAFCGSIVTLLRTRYKDDGGAVDEREVRSWIEQRWPLPVEAAFNIVGWARAFVEERKGRVAC
jgi:hypothetical protein